MRKMKKLPPKIPPLMLNINQTNKAAQEATFFDYSIHSAALPNTGSVDGVQANNSSF